MRLAQRAGETIMVDVEHLNYGKLVDPHNESLAAAEGLGVTRRSRGLNAAHVADLRLTSLLDVPLLDPSMIDCAMTRKGVLLVRTLPATARHFPGRTVLVRARFRPENGEGAPGRIHQQAAVWVIWEGEWRGYAQDVLRKAAGELVAEPDKMDEPASARFDVKPMPVELRNEEPAGGLSPSVRHILNMLLPEKSTLGEEDDATRSITFGESDFVKEEEFLLTVGTALNALPPTFNRWADICISSGLKPDCGALRIKYLPSQPSQLGDPPNHQSLERRIQAGRRLVRRSLPIEIANALDDPLASGGTPIAPAQARNSGAGSVTALDAPRGAAAKGLGTIEGFAAALKEYREKRTVETAEYLIAAARACELPSSQDALGAWADQRLVHAAVLGAVRGPKENYALGTVFDRALLFQGFPPDWEGGVPRQWLNRLAEQLAKLDILLPSELSSLKNCELYRQHLRFDDRLTRLITDSEEIADTSHLERMGHRERLALMGKSKDRLDKRREQLLTHMSPPSREGAPQPASIHQQSDSVMETILPTHPLIYSLLTVLR